MVGSSFIKKSIGTLRHANLRRLLLRPGTSQGKSQTALSVDLEDAQDVAFPLLQKRELKMPTKNIERSKEVKNIIL